MATAMYHYNIYAYHTVDGRLEFMEELAKDHDSAFLQCRDKQYGGMRTRLEDVKLPDNLDFDTKAYELGLMEHNHKDIVLTAYFIALFLQKQRKAGGRPTIVYAVEGPKTTVWYTLHHTGMSHQVGKIDRMMSVKAMWRLLYTNAGVGF